MPIVEIAEIHDTAPCVAVFVDASNGSPWYDQWTAETASKRLAGILGSPGFWGVAATQDGQLVGFALGTIEPFYDGDQFCLREMAVAPDAQGQGIGSRLLEEVEARLRGLGVREIYLMTSHANGISAFYEKSGYVRWASMSLMGKALSADRPDTA